MASYTTNYNLKKPAQSDNVNIGDFNDNADIIDATLYSKVDKVTGKGLSTNDFTTDEKNKLAGIAAGATAVTLPIAATNVTETTGRTFVSTAQATTISKAVTLDNYVRSAAYATTSGTSTAYTATLTYSITQYTEGMRITIVPHTDNGANATLAVSSLSAIPLIDKDGNAIKAGALKQGMPYEFLYKSANFILLGEGGEKVTLVQGNKTVSKQQNFTISGLSDYFDEMPQYIYINSTTADSDYFACSVFNWTRQGSKYLYVASSNYRTGGTYDLDGVTNTTTYENGTLTIPDASNSLNHFNGSYTYLLMTIK